MKKKWTRFVMLITLETCHSLWKKVHWQNIHFKLSKNHIQ